MLCAQTFALKQLLHFSRFKSKLWLLTAVGRRNNNMSSLDHRPDLLCITSIRFCLCLSFTEMIAGWSKRRHISGSLHGVICFSWCVWHSREALEQPVIQVRIKLAALMKTVIKTRAWLISFAMAVTSISRRCTLSLSHTHISNTQPHISIREQLAHLTL